MKPSSFRGININACAPKLDVDNGISLNFYYRIADNLLKQASIYREEKNHIDLYIILLRFSSLLCETIPSHRDYQVLLPKERVTFRRKLLGVINELESLKPHVQRQVDEMNRGHISRLDAQRGPPAISQPSWKYNSNHNPVVPLEKQLSSKNFLKPSFNLPQPREETLSRHSVLGPNGLRSQWNAPITGIKVQYPSNADLLQVEMPRDPLRGKIIIDSKVSIASSLDQPGQFGLKPEKEDDPKPCSSSMESVLSLDDGRWSRPSIEVTAEDLLLLNIRQPSPPPVLAHVQTPQELVPISPSKVADPRPGPAKTPIDGLPDSKAYQHLHIPVKMMECFLRLAEMNTAKNLETCGVLAGSLKNRMFCVTTLIIPKQEATSDYCQTTNEEEIFDFQDKRSLFPLGWIHTHPSQTCFMSSVDLHTHYSYQIMLPEAIAIVMAPTDESRTHGIFHLSDPGGVSVIRNCEKRGFHPHEEPSDGNPLYEHCSHVYMNPNMKFEVADLR